MPPSVSTKDLARILIMQKVVKIFQAALILLVNTNIRSAQQISKLQDEQAYTMMVEDFSKFIMRVKSISWI